MHGKTNEFQTAAYVSTIATTLVGSPCRRPSPALSPRVGTAATVLLEAEHVDPDEIIEDFKTARRREAQ
ncbi:hypothetical protein CLV30_11389 [Haloactinopolyspora alba]|uniref:Uncharacterized protein n=1 Tax=Haloactinopolyspora alba TaxID=648780 RepID=A0A2P8DWK9_9ACTN|nr:hypothetical protein CLV30_11389 [Haloactinopolyspora alba]